jgi:hypothetical protein
VTKARFVAQLLSKRFMAEGKIQASSHRIGSLDDGLQLAAAKDKEGAWEETGAFSKLVVTSVGVREGKYGLGPEEIAKPEVVILAAGKPTARFLKSLPKEIDGVAITVSASTQIGISPDQAIGDTTDPKVYTHKHRIACGSSICTATGSPGTLGALVTKDNCTDIFLLSCNHVLAARNQIAHGMPIISPAPIDASPDGDLPLAIARLSDVIELRFGDPSTSVPCEEDVALGKILDPKLVCSWQGDAKHGFDTPKDIVDPEDRMRVKKFGRSTDLSVGEIYANVYDPYLIQCNQPSKDFKSPAWFKNFAHVIADRPPFALAGDSGSLVVTEDEKAVVGLLFSANTSGNYGQIIPIRRVLKVLGVSLLSGHGI